MKLDEFAFVNQQLAGMLKSGVPLEGALRQLCETMRCGELRDELQALEADLAQGAPLRDALAKRKLPEFYVRMMQVGAQGNDLPGVLTLLADHYQRVNGAWMRLKGLMVYPLLVLGASLLLSLIIAVVYGYFLREAGSEMQGLFGGNPAGYPGAVGLQLNLWLPVVMLALLFGGVVAALLVPRWRRVLRWKIPAFKEAGLSQLASSLALMLQNGCHLDQALGLLRQLEAGSPAGGELERWQSRLAAGQKKFSDLALGGKIVPPLFIWLVAGSGEDWIAGFKQAAGIYHDRAIHRVEMLLYAVLPVSVLALGFLILAQVLPLLQLFLRMMQMLGDVGGGE
jgi:type II secretory pathway component PulF